MVKPTIWQRITKPFRFSESAVQLEQYPRKVQVQYEAAGSSGTANYGGYSDEEYQQDLKGRPAADKYDKIRRSDPKAKGLLRAVKNPLIAAHWPVEAVDDSEEQVRIKEFIEFVLFKDFGGKSWTQFLGEALTCVDFGYSLFEVTYKVVLNHPKYGSYNGIQQVGWRSPRTIERWNLNPATGCLKSVSQYAYGDLQRLVDISSEYLVLFSLDKEGDNYEGVSWLRPCYGPWLRKNMYLKLMAIGIERFAVPTPTLRVPEGKENSPQFAKAIQVLQQYISHQQAYITVPSGWDITFTDTKFDAEKVRAAIDAENTEMVDAFLANFLELGKNGTGSYALSFDQSDFFLTGIEHIASTICEELNQTLIPKLVRLNFGSQVDYPKLSCKGITDKVGKEFAEVIKILADGKIIVPDDVMEDDVRQRFGLSKKSDIGQRQQSAPTQSFGAFAETFKLAEPKKQITDDAQSLRGLMQENLKQIGSTLVSQIMNRYKNANDGQKLNAIKDLAAKGVAGYQSLMQENMALIAAKSIAQARKEVPKSKKVKLSEVPRGTFKLSEFDNLPMAIQKRIKSMSNLLVGTQVQDLIKTLSFRYQGSVDSTDSESLLESDLNESLGAFILGPSIPTGATDATAQIVNSARNAFFFDDEVLSEVESFTFVNDDPVSPICQDLNGTVFSKDDAGADRFMPPLHHNCKSYIVPNLVGNKNPKIDEGGLRPSKASLEKYITLAEPVQPTQPLQGLMVQSIQVSKKIASSLADAQRIAGEYQADTSRQLEMETAYRFEQRDAESFVEGSLKNFEPMEGVLVFVGLIKPPEPQSPITTQVQ